jgi:hypothetical protein
MKQVGPGPPFFERKRIKVPPRVPMFYNRIVAIIPNPLWSIDAFLRKETWEPALIYKREN